METVGLPLLLLAGGGGGGGRATGSPGLGWTGIGAKAAGGGEGDDAQEG